MTTLNLNLLLGSYSQSLLIQKAQASRSHPTLIGAAEEVNPGLESQAALEREDTVKKVEPIGQEDQERDSSILAERKKSVLERFGDSLAERIKKSKEYDPVAASATLERLVSEASDIGGTLGQAKANEFMNKVLVATDSSTDGDSIDLVVGSFFAQAAEASMVNPTAYRKLEDAKGEFSKLYNTVDGEEDDETVGEVDFTINPPPDPVVAQSEPTAQALLYKNYVTGNMPGPYHKPFLNNPVGNLFSAVA
ncbi:MAG: hypothetical protein LBF58_01740 [Deltaproteobacteria bacterium]|jgi:hypothetical protein|nr:hypothetical protein [Deltaproteobacteria bacterium]